jgi:hypothetical protein
MQTSFYTSKMVEAHLSAEKQAKTSDTAAIVEDARDFEHLIQMLQWYESGILDMDILEEENYVKGKGEM